MLSVQSFKECLRVLHLLLPCQASICRDERALLDEKIVAKDIIYSPLIKLKGD